MNSKRSNRFYHNLDTTPQFVSSK